MASSWIFYFFYSVEEWKTYESVQFLDAYISITFKRITKAKTLQKRQNMDSLRDQTEQLGSHPQLDLARASSAPDSGLRSIRLMHCQTLVRP